MVAPLEPLKIEKSSTNLDNIDRSSGTLKKYESPTVNLGLVFRDGSAIPNTR
jgi:hypothetical protein